MTGRPAPLPEEALDDRLTNRVNAIEKQRWKAAAKAARMSFSNWVRWALNEMASIDERQPGRPKPSVKRKAKR